MIIRLKIIKNIIEILLYIYLLNFSQNLNFGFLQFLEIFFKT